MAKYSDFWLIDRGRITMLHEWANKPFVFEEYARPAEPLPSTAELEAFSRLPLHERAAAEQEGYGFVISVADSQDRKRERTQRKRAA